jgi:hypothetical protein
MKAAAKKLFATFLAIVLLAAQTRSAFAQDAPAAATAPAAPGGPVVRANFRAGKLSATIYDPASGRMLCATPCTVDVPVNSTLRVVLTGGEDEPHDFVVTGEHGSQVDIEIKRGGKGALAGGIVMVSIGGAGALVGLLFVLVSAALDSKYGGDDDEENFRVAGLVTLVAGVGLLAGGIVLMSNRTNEATTRQTGTPPYGSKLDIFRSDMAAAGARDPSMMAVPPQLGWTFHF